MGNVISLFMILAFIVYFFHELVDEKIGTSARDHLGFWSEIVVGLVAVLGYGLCGPYFCVARMEFFIRLCGVSEFLFVIFVIAFLGGWWGLPFFIIRARAICRQKMCEKLTPLEKRYYFNIKRLDFLTPINKGVPDWLTEMDPPEEKVYNNGVEIPVIATTEEATAYKEIVAKTFDQMDMDDVKELTPEIEERRKEPLYRVLRKDKWAKYAGTFFVLGIAMIIILLLYWLGGVLPEV